MRARKEQPDFGRAVSRVFNVIHNINARPARSAEFPFRGFFLPDYFSWRERYVSPRLYLFYVLTLVEAIFRLGHTFLLVQGTSVCRFET